ncbi:hypothetical protein D0Z07_5251 [Hyphodiscus hymeniophilus]|uniref:Uncharacterized protein n=1 Tax=Hyphodiscus hymeniophilus TaxID=353542 RepID=A0A9P6VIC4_9HELO|nr:hypothetical protein D0Z07_5251 [Hyphodiscus hymeniophilus]
MGSTSSHLAYKRQKDGDNVGYFYHRGQAITLVNKAIVDGTAATEGIIATVACFLQQDALAASAQATKSHHHGMCCQYYLTTARCDLTASIVLVQDPQLEPMLFNPDISVYFRQPSLYTWENAKALGIRLLNFTELHDLSDVAMNIYWGLRNLTEIVEGFKAGIEVVDRREEELQFSDRVEVLERATHTLWYSNSKDPQTTIFRLFGCATLIYIYTILRELPSELRMLKLVAMRMKDQMERAPNLNDILATFPELMLWLLFLAGSVAEAERKPFFARQASKILLMKKIEDQTNILKASQDFLWPERHSFEDEGMEDYFEDGSVTEHSATTS